MTVEPRDDAVSSRSDDIYSQFKWASVAAIEFYYTPTSERKRRTAQKQIDLLARFCNVVLKSKAKILGKTEDVENLIKRVNAFVTTEPRYNDELENLRIESRAILDEYDRLITETEILKGV